MDRAREIMNVAYRLMLDKGYSAFSYADIAAEIGIRKASIHYHFPSKDDLVKSVLQDYRRKAGDSLHHFDEAFDAKSQLRSLFQSWEQRLTEDPTQICLCALMVAQNSILPAEARCEIEWHFDELRTWILHVLKRAREAGQYDGDDELLSSEATMILAAMHGGMLASRAFRDKEQFTIVTNQLLNRIFGG